MLQKPTPLDPKQANAVIVPALPSWGFEIGLVDWLRSGQRQDHPVACQFQDRKIVSVVGVFRHESHVGGVELAVPKSRFDHDGTNGILRDGEAVVNAVGRPGRDLVVVQRNVDVFGVSSVDAVAISIDDERIHEVSPWVYGTEFVHASALPELTLSIKDGDLQPHLVGVAGALSKDVSHFYRPNHGFQQPR